MPSLMRFTTAAQGVNNEKFVRLLKNMVSPVLGFGVGWMSWSVLDYYEIISFTQQQQIYLLQLRAERLCHRTLPLPIIEMLGMTSLTEVEDTIEILKRDIENGQVSGKPQDQRLGFTDALRECHIKEQIDWLEDHIQEEIPYFYIADLFDAFAQIHEGLLKREDSCGVPQQSVANGGTNGTVQYKRGDPSFVSESLCKGVFSHMCNGVIPFDVSVRVLAIMAYMNPINAATVAKCQDVSGVIVSQALKYANTDEEKEIANSIASNPPVTPVECISFIYGQYLRKLQLAGAEGGAPVSLSQVDIATIQLLKAIDEYSTLRSNWYKSLCFWAKPTLSFPALRTSKPYVKPSICTNLKVVNTLPVDVEIVSYADNAYAVLNCDNE